MLGVLTAIIVKSSDPDKFVSLVTKSADLLLQHLHHLSQESLDHADLSVLSATIGAAALIRNCLYIYLQAATSKVSPPKGAEKGGALKLSYKQYSQLAEALAERLLDLHCRLLSLYIIQDSDCLFWEDCHSFFESERGSYTVQMWWHYMHGTKDDLWNSVPPKMAQRIFAGMLNETLGILTVRYSQIISTAATTYLHLGDICNLLLCVSELLPHICENGEAYVGIEDMDILSARHEFPTTWLIFSMPLLFCKNEATDYTELQTCCAVTLELKVLLAFPEADWSYLIKVLMMCDGFLTKIILRHLLHHLPLSENFRNVAKDIFMVDGESSKCGAFLCRRHCLDTSEAIFADKDPVGQSNYQIVLSLAYLVIAVGRAVDIKSCLVTSLETVLLQSWSDFLDKRQIWNQKRPPWLEAITYFVYPALDGVVDMLIYAVEAGASTYQVMSLSLTCISEIWSCIPEGLYKIVAALQDVIPVSIRPLGDSVLMQIVFASLFTCLIRTGDCYEKMENRKRSSICYAIAEAICSIDENDKHTDQIKALIEQANESSGHAFNEGTENFDIETAGLSALSTVNIDDIGLSGIYSTNNFTKAKYPLELESDTPDFIFAILTSDILTSNVGKQVLKVAYNYLKNNRDWLMEQINTKDNASNALKANRGQDIEEPKHSVLRTMFFIGHKPFDQLLTGSLQIDYISLLQTPLSISPERMWLHLSRRCDFQDESKLSMPEIAMVAGVMKVIKKRKSKI